MTEWFIEKSDLNPGYGIAFSKDKVLYTGKSAFQSIEVFHNQLFGNVMLIDDLIMVTEKDEFVYHDMIVHVAMAVNPSIKKVLVIGGGDGGTVRELLKYSTIEHVDMVEIDKQVCDVAREFFPTLSKELDNPRNHLHFEDGVKFVKNSSDKTYDLIIIDSTDPISVGEGLFTTSFYQDCYRIVTDNGIVVNQSENPFVGAEMVQSVHKKMSAIFPLFFHYQATIPSYPGGMWLFGFGSKKLHPVNDIDVEQWNKAKIKTSYYTPQLHSTSFTLPAFVQRLVESKK